MGVSEGFTMSNNNSKYKVGDRIVEAGQLFRIFKIEKAKSRSGEEQKVIYYKPLGNTNYAHDIVCSIPAESIEQTSIRRPISKPEFKDLLKKARAIRVEVFPSITDAKDALKSNNPIDALKAIKALKKEKKNSENFNKNKKELLNSAIERVAYEFSEVFNVPIQKAVDKIKIAI